MRILRMNSIIAIVVPLVLSACLSGCGGPPPGTPASSTTITPPPGPVPNTATASGFTLSIFVKAPAATMKPDSIVQLGNSVYIGYQDAREGNAFSGAGL